MGAEANGLTLESLAQRLEALERENERMRSENAKLQGEVAALRAPDTLPSVEAERASRFDGLVSRRSLLSKAGAAAVGTVAAGVLMLRDTPKAKADHTEPGIKVDHVDTHLVIIEARAGDPALVAVNRSSEAGTLRGHNLGSGPGVRGLGGTGVWGSSGTLGHSGVYGQHTGTAGYGIVGDGKGEAGAGVLGRNPGGTGVWGQSSKTGYGGITGEHTGTSGYGVIGLGTGSVNSGVLGRNSDGSGMRGEGLIGVHGKATSGYGGLFEGGKAQLKITPKGSAGRPTAGAHVKGELYMDSAANLFVCTVSGTPGTWRRISTTAVA